MQETLQTRFLEIWRAQPKHEAVVDDTFRLTLDELMRYALALSNVLKQRGQSPVGHVGLLMPNCAPLVAGMFGILLAGKTIVPLNFLLPPQDLMFCIQDAEIHLL
ncbi:MAG: AMP-binding protein, partial [bacterium]